MLSHSTEGWGLERGSCWGYTGIIQGLFKLGSSFEIPPLWLNIASEGSSEVYMGGGVGEGEGD